MRHATTVIDMRPDGTGEQTETMVISVQSESAVKQFSVVSTLYAKQSQHADFVYVRVRHPDGTTVITPLGDVQDQAAPVTQQAPFYSDVMIKQLPVKGLRTGDTLEWQTQTTRTAAEAPGQFWGAESFPQGIVVEDETIELRVPTGMKLTVRTKPESNAQFSQSDADGRHTYHWSWKQLDPTVGAAAEVLKKARDAKPLTPTQEQDAADGALPDIAWTTFASWEAVGAWYRGLEGDRMKPDEAVRAKVAEITAGKTTQEDKVRAVYAWVSGQIRYVGVGLGVGRYQPHTAATVLENQYGDCKDKHTLLASMLLALGLQPDAVLAGPGIRFDQDVPSPASFNHLITRVSVDGKEAWLDSTSEVADYRVLLAMVRDKDVLVVPASGTAGIRHTPADLPFKPSSTFVATGALDSAQASDSTITITHHDDMEILLRAALRQASPAQYEELVQGMMGNYGFGGKVSEVEIEHVGDPALPLLIRFHYHRDREKDWGEDRVTALFGPSLLPFVDKKDLPHVALQLGPARADTSTLEMKLPAGWNMELPEPIHLHSSFADCDVTYRASGGSLLAERRFTVLQAKIPVTNLQSYADWYESCGAGSVPYLQLVRASASGHGASSTSQYEAKRLITEANSSIREGRYDQADAYLKQAQTLDSSASDLWGDLGAVAMHRGNQKEAMQLYAKELELHPQADFAYRNLARLQGLAGDDAAALETLTRWQKRSPTNPQPAIQAMQLLLSRQNDAEALKQAKAFGALLSDEARGDERFRLILGEVDLRGGESDAGASLLAAIASGSLTPSLRNDASYELAKAGQDLPLAEKAERAMLEQLAAESRGWTGGESQATLRQNSALMTAGWDTLGWILFKEGKNTEAEAWIRPAFAIRQSAEVGEHLGDIMMAQNKPADAASAYAEALATLPPADPAGLKAASPRSVALRTKLQQASTAAKITKTPDAHDALVAMRTFSIGEARGLTGAAEFQVLLSSSGIVTASPVGVASDTMKERITAAKWTERFPAGLEARFATKATLKCDGSVCEVVLEP
ncbi:DUF3857 domain-containing protein [Acidipila sp. EB88]|uniref:DUF3857 domain-containing protein n=1 Tax=Acidipila sp. EB88 TaxID=2305226 RepID=UPI00131577D4|nr:DUF3857 domain-containing protein [Acidipila sp. EB88]